MVYSAINIGILDTLNSPPLFIPPQARGRDFWVYSVCSIYNKCLASQPLSGRGNLAPTGLVVLASALKCLLNSKLDYSIRILFNIIHMRLFCYGLYSYLSDLGFSVLMVCPLRVTKFSMMRSYQDGRSFF